MHVVHEMESFVVLVSVLDQRLQQLSAINTGITPRNNPHLLDHLSAQQEKNQLALMQLQQQMQALSQPRFVHDANYLTSVLYV